MRPSVRLQPERRTEGPVAGTGKPGTLSFDAMAFPVRRMNGSFAGTPNARSQNHFLPSMHYI